MDVYHKVLHKLNEVTGGKNSKAVDFKDLVKKIGFHGNYGDIFERLNREGWISETSKADFVSITHWGVMEIKKEPSVTNAESVGELRREVNQTLAAARELAGLLEGFAADLAKNDFAPIEKKIGELQDLFAQVKGRLG